LKLFNTHDAKHSAVYAIMQ